MATIKGGIKFEGKEIPKRILDTGLRFPFEATGWKSAKFSELVPKGTELKELPKKEPVVAVIKYLYEYEYLKKLKLAELKVLAKKHKLTGTTKAVLIEKLRKLR